MITTLTNLRKADPAAISAAAAILRNGGLVAFPTETVYGLGADATNGEAVAAIFAAKGRPQFNPLIVHVRDRAQAEAFAAFSPEAGTLADAFWPGALTLVLPRRADSALSLLVSAGLDTVAIRAPSHALRAAAASPRPERPSPRPAPMPRAASAPPPRRMSRKSWETTSISSSTAAVPRSASNPP